VTITKRNEVTRAGLTAFTERNRYSDQRERRSEAARGWARRILQDVKNLALLFIKSGLTAFNLSSGVSTKREHITRRI